MIRNSRILAGMIILAMSFLVNQGCTPLGILSKTDLSSQYSGKKNPLSFSCIFFAVNDSLLQAKVRFPLDQLSPPPDRQENKSGYKVMISYKLFSSYRESILIDSVSVILADTAGSEKFLYHEQLLKAKIGRYYTAKVDFSDLNNGKEYFRIKPVRRISMSSGTSTQCESFPESPVYEPFLPGKEPVRLRVADTSCQALFCKVFFRSFQAALPPFIDRQREQFDYVVDSSFILPVDDGVTGYIHLKRQGFYFFQTDTNDLEGYTIFRAYQDYPKISTPLRMIEPLRYLTSSEEFEKLRLSSYPKTAVDSFWVQVTGGPDRAVEMIRSYYGRVEEANSFFFSFCEGWKTDRGMIYIIFGPPSAVYRSDTEEIWTYGEPDHMLSMQFVFMKVMNPFTENDYLLQRQSNYKTYWYNAVRQWRR